MDGEFPDRGCTPLPECRRTYVDNIGRADLLYDTPNEVADWHAAHTVAWENMMFAIKDGVLVLANPTETPTPFSEIVPAVVSQNPDSPPPTLALIADWERFALGRGEPSVVSAWAPAIMV